MCAALGLIASSTATWAQTARTDSISAPISGVSYEITINHSTANRGIVQVMMSFTADGSAPVLLSLPAWTPGAYEIANFARAVTAFEVTSDGKPLSWDKLGYDTWRIRTGGATTGKPVVVRFSYLTDSLDNAKLWVKSDFALFNGTNVFLYPEGRSLDFPATVTVNTEPDWKVATGMKAGGGARRYSATNYHDLVDMPFFVGKFDLDSAQVAGKWIRFASYPTGRVAGAARQTVWAQLKEVIPPEIAVFGEAPWDSYTVMEIVDSTSTGASGLEHQSSHVDVLGPLFVGSDFQPSLYAHEIFHSWNVKRLRPAEMWPYVYSRAQPTPWLWVSEGITDYYADLAEIRGHVVNDSGFYALTASKINEVRAAPPTALEDASLTTWIHPEDGTGYLYYPKGSLVGLMLDIIIRDASDNAHSLDTVMRELYQTTFAKGKGFTGEDFWGAVGRAAGGQPFTDFNARYVDGRDSLPWASILPKAGLRAVQQRVPRLGVFSQADPNGVLVTAVEPGGAAADAGVKPGDYLLSVGDILVEDQQFGPKFRAKYATMPEGSPLSIRIRRSGQPLTVTAQLRLSPGDVQIEADPNASAKAVRVRNGILGR